MGARHWKTLLAAITACVALAAPAGAQTTGSRAFDRGYREGVQQGEQDARDGHAFGIENSRVYRDGDRGYESRDGSRVRLIADIVAADLDGFSKKLAQAVGCGPVGEFRFISLAGRASAMAHENEPAACREQFPDAE